MHSRHLYAKIKCAAGADAAKNICSEKTYAAKKRKERLKNEYDK